MKTLVIVGAIRKNGHIRQMVDLLLEHLDGEREIIDAYCTEVRPCMDCWFCWKKKKCAVKDGMQEICQKLGETDNIILVSLMYFHSTTGRMKSLIDHFQVYWAGYMRNNMPETFLRKDTILMAGGTPSFENQSLGEEIILKSLLGDPSAEYLGQAYLPNNDRDSLETRPDIAAQVIVLTEKMNRVVK